MRCNLRFRTIASLGLLAAGVRPLVSQTCDTACNQFIASVNAAISSEVAELSPASHPIVYGGNLVYANGMVVAGATQELLLAYVDGLKAAGVQRVDLNPGLTSITNSTVVALYDATVQHIRELGMQLAINPEFTPGELGPSTTFQNFVTTAMQNYPQLVARYQPDVFVIVHEPTTATDGMHAAISQDWHDFILSMIPLLRAASPYTKLGAGAFQNGALPALSAQESNYFEDWATNIPGCLGAASNTDCLDYMTMDIYNDDTFSTYTQWASLAHANNKGAYIEELWAPHYLPNPLPAGTLSPTGYLTKSLDDVAILGALNPAFATMDATWVQGMSRFAAANGMEAMTAFTTLAFFSYGTTGHDKITDPLVTSAVSGDLLPAAGQQAQLTSMAQAFQGDVNGSNTDAQAGIPVATSISSASFATLPPNAFDPNCGTAGNPCNANVTVAPDALVSAFGKDLATGNGVTTSASFSTTLAGTTMTLVDSVGASYSVSMYSVSPGQVNYDVPGAATPGPATITIQSADGTATSGIVLVAPVAPGLYTANQNGQGAASGIAVCAGVCAGWPTAGQANGQFFQSTYTCSGTPSSCAPQPIRLATTDTVVVELFGTGLRHVSSTSAISGQVNGQSVPIKYAGAQGGYTGLDQINVMLPAALAGSGAVSLALTVNDAVNHVQASFNTVTIDIQ